MDIGDLGPKYSEATVYNWKLYHSIPSLMPWFILLGAIVLEKTNRNPQALLIFIPLFIIFLLWLGFVFLLNIPFSAKAQFDPIIVSYSVGIAMLWLLVHKFGNRKRLVRFIFAFGVMAVIGIVGSISYAGLEFSQQNFALLMMLAILSFAMLLGFVMAGWQCRNRYGHVRFILWLAFWTIVSTLMCILVFYSIFFLVEQISVEFSRVFLVLLISGSITGLISFIINLPFMILAFINPFFRKRFYACLRLRSMPAIADYDSGKEILNGRFLDPGKTEDNIYS